MKNVFSTAVFAALAMGVATTNAQSIVTSTPSDDPGPTVSATDLLQTSLAAGEGTVGNAGIGGTVAEDARTGQGIYASWLGNDLTNGIALTSGGFVSLEAFRNDTGLSNAATLSDGVWGLETATSRGSAVFTTDEFIEYRFDLSPAAAGFDITGIDLYSNWGSGDGRNEINTVISYSLVATPDVFDQTLITPAAYNPVSTGDLTGTQGIMSITGLTATGVAGIRFDFPAQENDGVGYSELDVFGSATEGTVSLGDFDNDGDVDLADLDRYIGNLGAAATGELAALDLNGDNLVDVADFTQHYSQLVEAGGVSGTLQGDANLDGTVDVLSDAAALVSSLGATSNTSWATGDFNADGMVDVLGDAAILVSNLGQSNTAGAGPATSAVPEPGSLSLLTIAGLTAVARRRR